ncbi:DUF1189 family protein [Halalkalibacillus halophilus]|uniref:DUF1189 family protein n=1 Tax=Halalkalibacillus halophilus TaxID=392827 RepID=UPI0004014D4D|nr:DUF1189 family protein [Halalkalibacillus halophilus]
MKVNMIKRFSWSIHNFKKASALRIEKVGKSIWYLLLFMLLLTIPYVTTLVIDANQSLNQLQDNEEIQDLSFTYQRSGLSYDGSEDVIEHHNLAIVFDESLITEVDQDTVLLMQEEQGTLFTNRNSYTFLYESMFANGESFTIEQLGSELLNFILVLMILSTAIYYCLSVFIKLAEITLLAFGGFIINRNLKRNVNYAQLWKLSVYAITIPTIIVTTIQTTGMNQNYSGVIFWIGSFIILYMILSKVPKKKS